MKKKKSKRVWVGKIRQATIWISEEEMAKDFAWIQKMHPGTTIEETIDGLVEKGFILSRINNGKREVTINKGRIDEEIAKLDPDVRNSRRALGFHEDVAIICDYNADATALISTIEQQLMGHSPSTWLEKTHEEVTQDSIGLVENIPAAMLFLETKNFIELATNGPETFRYRLNVSVVQSALDALPEKDEAGND